MAGALNASSAPKSGWKARVGRLLGLGEEDGAAPPGRRLSLQDDVSGSDQPAVETLAYALAELIASAQSRVDGAATLVEQSADEAKAYRHALADEARALDSPEVPSAVAAALIEVTRSMMERARGAEARLRHMGSQLETLQHDLREARECAEHDQLTGLPNRRGLESALARAVAAARAADTALSLAFCDIDHFKQINDVHGHAVGDRVLRVVGDSLADGVGDTAFVGRQGGEEFVMLFEGLDAEETKLRVDAIRERLAARTLRSRTSNEPIGNVTFSAGVATLGEEEAAEDLLRRADRALYAAKGSGRNRVEIDEGD